MFVILSGGSNLIVLSPPGTVIIRAGRYLRSGTFGTTGDAPLFNEEAMVIRNKQQIKMTCCIELDRGLKDFDPLKFNKAMENNQGY